MWINDIGAGQLGQNWHSKVESHFCPEQKFIPETLRIHLTSRCPSFAEGWAPAAAQPRIDLWTTKTNEVRNDEIHNIVGANGMIIERTEIFRIPTIERARLQSKFAADTQRVPAIESAFNI